MLGLVMIVKDEARGIVRTLESVLPFIDRWTILDTGSTDGTQGLISETLARVPGSLHEEPFVDFATTRNRALHLADGASEFMLMLSGDELLHDGARLRAFCEAHRITKTGAFYVTIESGITYKSARLIRSGSGWHYVGLTHEVLVKDGEPPPTITVPSAYVEHGGSGATRERWELDLKLLRTASASDTRAAFYVAQTLECLGMLRDALAAYEHRIALGGWVEEVYESLFRCARVRGLLGHAWPDVQQAYLDAHAFDPRRAEPLHEIAKHWHALENHALAYLFASRAAALPKPDVALFVDPSVYDWRAADLMAVNAWYLSAKTGDIAVRVEGRLAAVRALAGCPDDDRLRANVRLYDEAAIQRWAEDELRAMEKTTQIE